MVQHEEILYMERIIAFSNFGYDYGIPFHSSENCLDTHVSYLRKGV